MIAVGTGIIILAVLWSIAIVAWILTLRLGPPYVFAGFVSFVLAAIVTIILWAIPKGPLPPEDPNEPMDYAYAGRLALIIIYSLMCFFGFVIVAAVYLFQQIYAISPKPYIGL